MALDLNGFTFSASGNDFSIGPNVTMTGGYSTNSTGMRNAASPAFSGWRQGTPQAINANPWSVNTTVVNNGSYFTSGTTFTCPVDGNYFASLTVITSGQGVANGTNAPTNYVGLLRNGNLYAYSLAQTNNGWDNTSFATIMRCTAGDTITGGVNVAGVPVGNGLGAYANDLNMLNVFLLG